MRRRNIAIMVLLTVLTGGIYYLFWTCSVQNQIKRTTGRGFGGVGHFFMIFFFSLIYLLYWHFVIAGRINRAGGPRNRLIGWIYFLGYVGGIVVAVVGMSMIMSDLINWLEYMVDVVEAGGTFSFDTFPSLGFGLVLIFIGPLISYLASLIAQIMIQVSINRIGRSQ